MKDILTTSRWLIALAWRTDRVRLVKAFILLASGHLATPAAAMALGAFTDHAVEGAVAAAAALGGCIALLLVAELMLGHFAHLYYFEVGEKAEAELVAELADRVNGSPGMEHLDSAEFADSAVLVGEEIRKLRAYVEALLQIWALAVQLTVTSVLLGSLDLWLLLLPLSAVPPVLMSRYAQRLIERGRHRAAERVRLARHLLHTATSSRSAQEARIAGAAPALVRRHDRSWSEATGIIGRGHTVGAAIRALGLIVFALSCCAAVYLVLGRAVAGTASIGDVVLTITLAVQLNGQVTNALQNLATLQSVGHTVRRLESLRGAAEVPPTGAPAAAPVVLRSAPRRLEDGIRLEGVGFTYPGTDREVVRGIDLHLAAGRTTALVGENGAGKTTLVKLLCGLYRPTSGRILVDGVDMEELDPREWRARVATLFQDFVRLEFLAREHVGAGDLSRLRDDGALSEAVAKAGAGPVLERVPGGLDGPLGRGYTDGAELSGGQWQTLSLARASLRSSPLLQVLDEPASALDAAAEHAVFDRYAASAAEGRAVGGVTLFVSHRFSTVRMADQIVVLEQGRVEESGGHEALMANGGLYADLFSLQANSYR
ncbi:ABC transporter ATP-binding protein [Nocardiopsis baichengensis]|uniref:ABC transporter ATP-binding protein n=1 Tax=Nocardiopsis baichengensis TaxID=280240 RepID=UPI00034BFE33|nr:ABC transporter ATP-binding protein [Nocardiopsis baichengensis]